MSGMIIPFLSFLVGIVVGGLIMAMMLATSEFRDNPGKALGYLTISTAIMAFINGVLVLLS